ncbi:hypothetical protein FACS189442_6550 [Spirochaetia bacterium]|nr:hypothetical protein FACS189442_6550 [Spirochaetia bacterium]
MNDFNVKSYLAAHKTEVKGTRRYEEYTIKSNNLIARFSHRKRIEKSIEYIIPRLELGNVLDYGCGTGVFFIQSKSRFLNWFHSVTSASA